MVFFFFQELVWAVLSVRKRADADRESPEGVLVGKEGRVGRFVNEGGRLEERGGAAQLRGTC